MKSIRSVSECVSTCCLSVCQLGVRLCCVVGCLRRVCVSVGARLCFCVRVFDTPLVASLARVSNGVTCCIYCIVCRGGAFSKIHILVPGIFMVVMNCHQYFCRGPLLLMKQAELFVKLYATAFGRCSRKNPKKQRGERDRSGLVVQDNCRCGN